MNISVVSNMINTTIMLNMCICIILGLIVSNIQARRAFTSQQLLAKV